MATADLCDAADEDARVADPVFRSYGGTARFAGPVRTLRVFEDNSLVRDALAKAGHGAVLVVDGGGSTRCALLGGNLAQLALDNGWAGIVINGCVRDRLELDRMEIGICALATCPRRSVKRGTGEADCTLRFAGIDVRPGDYLYADEDGLVVAGRDLLAASR